MRGAFALTLLLVGHGLAASVGPQPGAVSGDDGDASDAVVKEAKDVLISKSATLKSAVTIVDTVANLDEKLAEATAKSMSARQPTPAFELISRAYDVASGINEPDPVYELFVASAKIVCQVGEDMASVLADGKVEEGEELQASLTPMQAEMQSDIEVFLRSKVHPSSQTMADGQSSLITGLITGLWPMIAGSMVAAIWGGGRRGGGSSSEGWNFFSGVAFLSTFLTATIAFIGHAIVSWELFWRFWDEVGQYNELVAFLPDDCEKIISGRYMSYQDVFPTLMLAMFSLFDCILAGIISLNMVLAICGMQLWFCCCIKSPASCCAKFFWFIWNKCICCICITCWNSTVWCVTCKWVMYFATCVPCISAWKFFVSVLCGAFAGASILLLIVWLLLAGGVYILLAALSLTGVFVVCFAVSVAMHFITCGHQGSIDFGDFVLRAVARPLSSFKVLMAQNQMYEAIKVTVKDDLLGMEQDGTIPLLKGRPKMLPLGVSNPVFAFTLGSTALGLVSVMNLYVDTWMVQYINVISYKPSGEPVEVFQDLFPEGFGDVDLATDSQRMWTTANNIIKFAYFDCWALLPPVLEELLSFDQITSIFQSAGFSGSVPTLSAGYFLETVLQVRILSSLSAGFALGLHSNGMSDPWSA